jgi:hypothetical protein
VTHAHSGDVGLAPTSGHPDALVGPTFAANTSLHLRGVRAVLEVVSAGCRQSSLQPLGSFRVGLGQPPHLVGCQVKVAEHPAERLAAVDRFQELLPYLGGSRYWARVRRRSLIVGVRPGTERRAALGVPPAFVPCAVCLTRVRVAERLSRAGPQGI